MAKLDNTGTTFIDAVITETGRRLLAQGGFKVTKFGLGDDELNYIDYINTSTTPDSNLLKTPISEAGTDAPAALQRNLVSFNSQDYTYLPTAAVVTTPHGGNDQVTAGENAGYRVLLTDQTSVDKFTAAGVAIPAGYQEAVYDGSMAAAAPSETGLIIDCGVRAGGIVGYDRYSMPAEFQERYFLVQLDDRFLKLLVPFEGSFLAGGSQSKVTTANIAPSIGVDDQNIRTYEISINDDPTFFRALDPEASSPINGGFSAPRSRYICAASNNVKRTTQMWTSGKYPTRLISNWFTNVNASLTGDAYVLDTAITIIGGVTGVSNTSHFRLVRAA